MAAIPGSVRFTGFVAPTDSTDTYAVIDPIWGIDSWRSVADLTARDAITADRRRQGMAVWVVSENKLYVLKTGVTNLDWVEFTSGSSVTGTIEQLSIISDGQTSFTLANTPTNIFGVVLDQGVFVGYGTDFIVSGTTLTWLNPSGITMNIGDTAYFIYGYAAIAPIPETKYLPLQVSLGTISTSSAIQPFNSATTNSTSTIEVSSGFTVPADYTSFISLKYNLFVGASSGGAAYNYTIGVSYCDNGDLASAHTSTSVVNLDFTLYVANTFLTNFLDLSSYVSGILVPGRRIGISVVSDLTHQISITDGTFIYI